MKTEFKVVVKMSKRFVPQFVLNLGIYMRGWLFSLLKLTFLVYGSQRKRKSISFFFKQKTTNLIEEQFKKLERKVEKKKIHWESLLG